MKALLTAILFSTLVFAPQEDLDIIGNWVVKQSFDDKGTPCNEADYNDFFLNFKDASTYEMRLYATQIDNFTGSYKINRSENNIDFTYSSRYLEGETAFQISIIEWNSEELVLNYGLCVLLDSMPNPGRLELIKSN